MPTDPHPAGSATYVIVGLRDDRLDDPIIDTARPFTDPEQAVRRAKALCNVAARIGDDGQTYEVRKLAPVGEFDEAAAYERGVAAGRKQAAAEIAAKFRVIVTRCDHDPKLQRAYEMAALVVEEHVAEESNHAD